MTFHRRTLLAAAAASALSPIAPLAFAQASYPARRVSLVVPFPAGGPADMVARVMQPLVQKALGEVVIRETLRRVVLDPDGIGGGLLVSVPALTVNRGTARVHVASRPQHLKSHPAMPAR